jgi:hypothetical protein
VITEVRCGGVAVKEVGISKDASLVNMRLKMRIKTNWMTVTKTVKHYSEMLDVYVVKKLDTE